MNYSDLWGFKKKKKLNTKNCLLVFISKLIEIELSRFVAFYRS